MKVSIENVTPTKAKAWLLKNNKNRKLSQTTVNYYSSEFSAERWQETGESIKFFDDGEVADGQHRLMAIIQSGCSVTMLVVRGLAREAMYAIDTGKKRTVADILHLHSGVADSNVKCAAARQIVSLCFHYQNYTLGAGLTEIVLKKFSEEIQYVSYRMAKFKPARNAWVHGAVAFGMKSHPELKGFADILGSGEDAKRGNPALSVRNWLIGGTSMHLGKSYKAGAYECLFNAMSAYVRGEKITMMKSGPSGANYFRSRQRGFIESLREDISRIRPDRVAKSKRDNASA